MTRRIIAAVGRALSTRPADHAEPRPHFHQGAQGNVAACFAHSCDRPQMHVVTRPATPARPRARARKRDSVRFSESRSGRRAKKSMSWRCGGSILRR